MKAKSKGFTLLEVLVALAIFAIVGAALVKNSAHAVKQTTLIQDRTVALWLAENQLSEIRSTPRVEGSFPSPGTDRIETTMAGSDWQLVVDYEATENTDMRRVTVTVFHADNNDNSLVSLSGFVGRF